MSEDVSYELQVAIVARLKADANVAALVSGRIYDYVPRDAATGKVTATFPYVSFGPEQDIPEQYDCIDASEIVMQLDGWSRDPGFREVKRIANAVKSALQDAPLPINDNALVYLEYDGRRVFRDPDGVTSQAAITFRIGVEKR
jgi:hypothetical protein